MAGLQKCLYFLLNFEILYHIAIIQLILSDVKALQAMVFHAPVC